MVVGYNAANGEVYSIQHYVIKYVDGLRQAGGFGRSLLNMAFLKTQTYHLLM
jgi:hypothetical protein